MAKHTMNDLYQMHSFLWRKGQGDSEIKRITGKGEEDGTKEKEIEMWNI